MRRFVRLRALATILVFVVAVLQVLPSFAAIAKFDLPDWIENTFTRKFQLGLDLQGGLHLEYSVAVEDAVENKLDQIAAELEGDFKEKKDVEVSVERVSPTELEIRFPSPDQVELATDDVMGIVFGTLEVVEDSDARAAGVIRLQMPDAQLAETRKAIVGQAIDTVRRRVDAMGIAEPSIYPKNRQVVVELPGLSDTTTELRAATVEVSKTFAELLRAAGAPQVSVVDVREDPGAFQVTVADRDAKALLAEVFGAGLLEERLIVDQRLAAELEIVPPAAGATVDPATVVVRLTDAARDDVLTESSDFRRLLRAIERAAVLEMHLVDDETLFKNTGVPYLRALFEAGFVTEGLGISVSVGEDYGRPDKGGVVVKTPFALYAKDRETLERFFAGLPPEWRLPSTHKIAYGTEVMQLRRGEDPVAVWRTWVIKSRADLTGDRIVNATVIFSQDTGTPQVQVTLDRLGADAFETMSGDNVGRKMAIIMDETVVSDPIFNERIPGGSVVITLSATPGDSVRDQANDLVKVLKSGSLPARLNKEFEIRVGADLGREAVESGFWSFVIGLSAVVLFMAIYYRGSGLVAVFALVLNVTLLLAAMSLFQATLTLPGIAGIVLTLGMAVDANVIIYERIREYLREGYTARAAIEAGYDRALTTILDSQLTTAIAGLVLWQYGSGPIRGFAITLLIGIVTSIVTGVFSTRVFFDWASNRRGYDRVSI